MINAKLLKVVYVASASGVFVSIGRSLWPQGLVFLMLLITICLGLRKHVRNPLLWFLFAWPVVGGALTLLIDPNTTAGSVFGVLVMILLAIISYRIINQQNKNGARDN